MKLEFSLHFSKNTQKHNSMKIWPMGAELFHADRWTYGQRDKTKLTVTLCNSANTPNN